MFKRRVVVAVASAVLPLAVIGPMTALATNPCTNASPVWAPSDTSSRYITPPGGQSGKIEAKFSSVWKFANIGVLDNCHVVSGTSNGHWYGSVPFNATSMKLTDEW